MHLGGHAPFSKQPFLEIRAPTVNKHARIVENRIASDIETNEAFLARETNPAVFDKLEGYNPKGRKSLLTSGRARSTHGQANGLGQDRGFNSFASNMIKLSVNETKWSSLLGRTRALILYISI